MVNFTDFTLQNSPLTSNFVVGYNPEGTDENRYTLESIKNTVLNDGNLTLNSVSATSINTRYYQAPFTGQYWPLNVSRTTISNNTTAAAYKSGRYTMLNYPLWGNTPTVILEETQSNRFVQGDIVSVMGFHINGWQYNVKRDNPLRIFYRPFNGNLTFLYSLTGDSGYDTGYIFFEHNGTTFLSAGDKNIDMVAGSLIIEKGQPQDPGTPLSVLGRGRFVHGLNLDAGDLKFTNGSDHFHLIQQNQNSIYFQKINGGYNWKGSRLTEHSPAQTYTLQQTNIVSANSLTLSGTDPDTDLPPRAAGNTYISLWVNSSLNGNTSYNVGRTVLFNVSNTGNTAASMRSVGFTAATYPCKVVHSGAIGTPQSNSDIPSGQSISGSALWHLRLAPLNGLTIDNWNRGQGAAFNGNLSNANEFVRIPGNTLVSPKSDRVALSAIAGYDTLEVANGCEVILNLTTSTLTSAAQAFLYEGQPVLIVTGTTSTLSATNFQGFVSTKSSYGPTTTSVSPFQGEITGAFGNYVQSLYDGYIFKVLSNKIVVRVGMIRGADEEARISEFSPPNINWFKEIPWNWSTFGSGSNIITNATLSDPPLGLSSVPFNGYRVSGVSSFGGIQNWGLWTNGTTGALYTMPETVKSGLELASTSIPELENISQVYIYPGNKDPVHRPMPGLQLYSYERYPANNVQFKEQSGMVSKFAIGPVSEALKRDSAVVGFNSTSYHSKSMAIGHRAETTENNQITIAANESILRLGNTSLLSLLSGSTNVFVVERDGSLNVNNSALSSNGTNTYLKLKSGSNTYGLKLDIIG